MKLYRAKGMCETVKEWMMWRSWSSCQISLILTVWTLQKCALDCPQTLRPRSPQPLGIPQHTSVFAPTWNPPVCTIGRWCKSPTISSKWRTNNYQTAEETPLPSSDHLRSDIKSKCSDVTKWNFPPPVWGPESCRCVICYLSADMEDLKQPAQLPFKRQMGYNLK